MDSSRPAARPTIKDVAAMAGVSWMTVSRVIRNPSLVAEKTRVQVQAAIDKLNYIPDLSAGSLSSQQSSTVVVVLPSLHFEGHIRSVDGLSSTLREHGFHLLIADYFYSQDEEIELLKTVLGRRPAGIVLVNSMHSQKGRKLLLSTGVPLVETWDYPKQPMDAVVGFSHAKVGYALAQHLIEQSYERIAFIGGPDDLDPKGVERRNGYFAAMKAHGLDASRVISVPDEHLTIAAGKTAIGLLLDKYPDTDAAICLTDRVAMGAMMECERRGIRVPEQLAITGHGGFDFSAHLLPALTTTRVNAFEIGRKAADIIINRARDKEISKSDQRVELAFEVVERASSVRNR